MISKTQTRKSLRQTLKSMEKDGKRITYPMTKFRHAIFDTVDKCKSLQFHSWAFDTGNKLTICYLYFKSIKIECSYNYQKDDINVSVFNIYKDYETLSLMFHCKCEDLSEEIKKIQPKIKIVRKKK